MTVGEEARPDAPPADTTATLDLTALRHTWAVREAARRYYARKYTRPND